MNNKKDLTKIFEKIFKEEIFNNNLKSLFLACYVAIIAVPSFCIVDYYMYPAQYKEIAFIRLMVTLLNIIILVAAKNIRMLQKYSIQLGFLVIFFCAFGISVMIHITEGYQSPYYAGLVLANLVLCTFLIVPMRVTIILSSIIYALYIIPILFKGNIEYISIFVNNNIFLISMMIFAVLGARSREELRFNEFSARYNIQKANEDLEKLTDELAETNQKLLTHDRLKTEFFTNVSHELRTPLTLILAPLKPLIEGNSSILPPVVKETLVAMQNNGHRLLKQINNLLDFSKLEAGKLRLNIENIDLIGFCKDIISAMQHAATTRGLKLYFQYQMGDPIKVMIDAEQFEKVIMNLLHNAIKFTPQGGRITLFLDERDDDVELVVQDTGVGIPENMLETIFDRFAQVDGSSTRSNEGTGLGLSLAKEIVELHGGEIRAESVQGKGSRFIVRVQKGERHIGEDIRERRKSEQPVQYKKRASDAEGLKVSDVVSNYRDLQLIDLEQKAEIETRELRQGTHEYTLLVIDDNPDILKLMHFLLNDEFDLILAGSGKEGLKALPEKKPDLVICDMMMPEMDGNSFCREVKSDPDHRHIPIIMVTARAGSEMLVEGINSGANDYLAKPFDVAELKARVRSLLRTRTMEEALALANQNLKIRTDDLVERQRLLLHSTVKSLVSTIEAKDNYTKDHSLRVSKYSIAIAKKMGYAEHELNDLELAALLHDVGKIAVPEDILHYNGKLTEEEFGHIKNHPANGAQIIRPITEFKSVASIVIAHHEHYNGKGYPFALYKDDIPLGARVMAVADAYDAMTSERSYRAALSHNYTVKEIVRCSGTQFDPGIVDVFLTIQDKLGEIRSNDIQGHDMTN